MKYTKQDWINGKFAIIWRNTKSTQINDFINELIGSTGEIGGWYAYYAYDKDKGTIVSLDTTDLPIVDVEDIIEREIYSYKIKPEKEWTIPAIEKLVGSFKRGAVIYGGDFMPDSIIYDILVGKGLLEELCDSIYESEKRELTLGDKQQKVIVSRGSITYEGQNIPFNELLNLQKTITGNKVAGFDLKIETFALGCTTFTVKELEYIISIYNILNK